MKTTIVSIAALFCATVAVAQVRVIDAPYQAQTPPQVSTAQGNAQRFAGQGVQAGFEVTPADGNLRKTLIRWTRAVGWTFEAEHWTLANDIPVTGSASLGNDFKSAVRTLLASSELTDLPAQPCFYSNNVLRIIPINELCARQQKAISQ
jgi:hypothetical protein